MLHPDFTPTQGEKNVKFRDELGLFFLRNEILSFYSADQSNLKGMILTIIDASISDPTQRKALKDLIIQAFYRTNFNETARDAIWRWCRENAPDFLPEDKDGFFGILRGFGQQVAGSVGGTAQGTALDAVKSKSN